MKRVMAIVMTVAFLTTSAAAYACDGHNKSEGAKASDGKTDGQKKAEAKKDDKKQS